MTRERGTIHLSSLTDTPEAATFRTDGPWLCPDAIAAFIKVYREFETGDFSGDTLSHIHKRPQGMPQ